MLLREPLSRSQTVACAEVHAGAFKALASLAFMKNLLNGQTLWSVFQDGSNETKTRVHVSWSITAGARNGRLWRTRTPSMCDPVVRAQSKPRPTVKRRSHKLIEQSSSSIIVMTSSRARNVPQSAPDNCSAYNGLDDKENKKNRVETWNHRSRTRKTHQQHEQRRRPAALQEEQKQQRQQRQQKQ